MVQRKFRHADATIMRAPVEPPGGNARRTPRRDDGPVGNGDTAMKRTIGHLVILVLAALVGAATGVAGLALAAQAVTL